MNKTTIKNSKEVPKESIVAEPKNDLHIESINVPAGPVNATVTEGSSHMLHCLSNITNVPVIWFKQQKIVSGDTVIPGLQLFSNNSILITKMDSSFQGVYTCVILSPNGALVTNAWIFMERNVTSECDLEFIEQPKDKQVQEGQHTFLECYAPKSKIRWFKDGKPITLVTGRVEILLESFLLINKVKTTDAGIYVCTAFRTGCTKSAAAKVTVLLKQNVEAVCGLPKANSTEMEKPDARKGKIIAGNSASRGSFPWQAMLWDLLEGSFCGGTLLNDQWIITAAHCFSEFHERFSRPLTVNSLIVKLGKNDQTKMEMEEELVAVNKFITHPKFDRLTYDNDIALIQLKKRVHFSDYVIPICLGNDTFLEDNVYSRNVFGIVTGWGLLTEDGNWPKKLQQVKLPIIDRKFCIDSTPYNVTENMFCAGHVTKNKLVIGDACHGDSGGPFAVKIKTRWYLAGIVSWGEGCDREGKYGFYVKVGNYIDWIRKIITAS